MSGQPIDAETVSARLSPERMSPYAAACAGNTGRALDLHAWNTAISAVFYETLQVAEVALRNAFHEQLTVWDRSRGGDGRWYLRLPALCDTQGRQALTDESVADIVQARRRAVRDGKMETAGRVVAELNFGFWRFLLSRRYEHVLWAPALRHAFRNGLSRSTVDRQVRDLHQLRNRIAHHEPVFNRDLVRDHERALELIGWMCLDTRRWVESASRFAAILQARP